VHWLRTAAADTQRDCSAVVIRPLLRSQVIVTKYDTVDTHLYGKPANPKKVQNWWLAGSELPRLSFHTDVERTVNSVTKYNPPWSV
jgi:hypothetical protein